MVFSTNMEDLIDESEKLLRTVEKHINRGVLFCDMNAVIAEDAEIGEGTKILPGVVIDQGVKIGKNCVIGPNAMLRNCTIGDGAEINASQITDSSVDEGTTVGPFSHIRNNCKVGKNCRIGNFMELKNSNIDEGSKMAHLSYIGDTDMGKKVNIGCGTITVNYDGYNKSRTVIGDNSFVGCNSNLIAPVRVGNNTLVAAATTVHEDVPDGAMVISRLRQTIKEGAKEKIFEKNRQIKEQNKNK